jgi:hypothetical protein
MPFGAVCILRQKQKALRGYLFIFATVLDRPKHHNIVGRNGTTL